MRLCCVWNRLITGRQAPGLFELGPVGSTLFVARHTLESLHLHKNSLHATSLFATICYGSLLWAIRLRAVRFLNKPTRTSDRPPTTTTFEPSLWARRSPYLCGTLLAAILSAKYLDEPAWFPLSAPCNDAGGA